MKQLVLGASLVALLAPAAWAQTMPAQAPAPTPGVDAQVGPGTAQAPATFTVFFGFDSATLDAAGLATVAEAARAFEESGAARIEVTGFTDTAGPADYNQQLSERRAEAVRAELVRQGVPAGAVQTMGLGESDPLVMTGPGVPEAQNRRVEIAFERPPPVAAPEPAPAPVVAAPEPAPPPPALQRYEFTLGALYGHNYRERDTGTESDFIGGDLGIAYLVNPNFAVTFNQNAFWAYNASRNGAAGRSVAGLQLRGDWDGIRPYIGLNAGGIYGRGVQHGAIVGPELGVQIDLGETTFLYAKAEYDYQFRNPWGSWNDFDRGILYGGAGIGFRF